jgi:hypothetical protein
MQPALGLTLTYTTTLDSLRHALDALGASWLKIVPAWCPFAPAEIVGLGRRLLIRTSWGDPSFANGMRAYPATSRAATALTSPSTPATLRPPSPPAATPSLARPSSPRPTAPTRTTATPGCARWHRRCAAVTP